MLTIGIHGIPDSSSQGHAHDHALAFMRDGMVLACMELERFSRTKQDGTLPDHFDALLKPWLLPDEDLQFVLVSGFYGRTFHSNTNSLELQIPDDLTPEKLLVPIPVKLNGILDNHSASAWAISHEAAHICTCLPFFGPFQEDSLLVHIDGGASVSSSSCWLFRNGSLQCLGYDWNRLKRVVNYFNDNEISRKILGLPVSDHLAMPGKLMGFSSHGHAIGSLTQEIRSFSDLPAEKQFLDHYPNLKAFMQNLKAGSDPTKIPGSANIASSMQLDFEKTVLDFLAEWKERTGAKRLYYSGGAALNIHANARIERELGFEQVFVPPNPGDCGLALGAAALLESQGKLCLQQSTPFLVSSSQREKSHAMPMVRFHVEQVAKLIANGKVVGTCLGAGETGPRALGHRSILARPDDPGLRMRISEVMKQREWYRPVAPMMLLEIARQVLENYPINSNLSQFMLGAWQLKSEYHPNFSGVVHADGTVRAQTVSSHWVELEPIRALLHALRQEYGLMGIINTSFNKRGEPIVQTKENAITTARALGLDAVWLEMDGESCVLEL